MESRITVKLEKLSVFDFFAIKNISPVLLNSVKKYGIIEPVTVVSEEGGNFIIIDGVSRFYCAKQSGLSEVPVNVLCAISDKDKISNFLKKEIIKKNSQESLSSAERILSVLLNKELDIISDNRLFFENDLNIQPDVISFLLHENDEVKTIINYAVKRNIPLKILAEIAKTQTDTIKYLAKISQLINPKQNLMRQIVLLVNDLVYAGTSLPVLDENREYDELSILDELHRLRYPDFHNKENYAKIISRKVDELGASISFPPYFEGGYAEIKIKLTGKSNINKVDKVINSLNDPLLNEIIDFLKSGC